MMLRPLGMNVLIARDQTEDKVTESGLYIPQSVQERPQTATVVAAGPGDWVGGCFVSMPVYPGEKILIGKYSGADVEIGGRVLTIIPATDILGVLEDGQSTEGE